MMQTSTELTSEAPADAVRRSRSPDPTRTLVIVFAQVVAIVALAVLWQVLRSRRRCDQGEMEAAA
jgi:hypothetical protein